MMSDPRRSGHLPAACNGACEFQVRNSAGGGFARMTVIVGEHPVVASSNAVSAVVSAEQIGQARYRWSVPTPQARLMSRISAAALTPLSRANLRPIRSFA